MAIVAWYYAVYGSASAMIAVADGSFQQTHAATANQWDQIFGCIAEYLSGTSSWEQWNIEQRVRGQSEFKKLGVDNFRTKEAQALRDNAFKKVNLSFLHQAFRYRGKANYRDAIFLAYGKNVPTLVAGLIDDLTAVAIAFSTMAAAYVSVRVGKDIWNPFIDDLEKKRSVSIAPKSLWS